MNGPFLTERAMNHSIADFQLPIADFRTTTKTPIGNWQSI
jgi:hypothetical protein